MSGCGCCDETPCVWDDLKYHELWVELMNGTYFKATLQGMRDEDWLVFEDESGSLRYVDRYSVVQFGVVYDN